MDEISLLKKQLQLAEETILKLRHNPVNEAIVSEWHQKLADLSLEKQTYRRNALEWVSEAWARGARGRRVD